MTSISFQFLLLFPVFNYSFECHIWLERIVYWLGLVLWLGLALEQDGW